jgi:hypothetical protein
MVDKKYYRDENDFEDFQDFENFYGLDVEDEGDPEELAFEEPLTSQDSLDVPDLDELE